jgi:hypothetical protein
MTDKPEISDTELAEIIHRKLAAGDADSGWMNAALFIRAMPILKEIAKNLEKISKAIDETEEHGTSVSQRLSSIAHWTERVWQVLSKKGEQQ